ncbi:hypothetical protein PUN28_012852 [Cardiocondyla obscurior]|uniref:Uncharacterized protein n=1 Tax=Cardiocondyla obscurior TaxID=286306 RepID=A0AAW2F8H4_9HYME
MLRNCRQRALSPYRSTRVISTCLNYYVLKCDFAFSQILIRRLADATSRFRQNIHLYERVSISQWA